MNVVFDTNVLVSAIGFDGKPEEVINLVIARRIIGFTSKMTLIELRQILSTKLKLGDDMTSRILRQINKRFIVVDAPHIAHHALRDSDDNHILAVTHEIAIDYIISGDKDLLTLREYNHVPIVTPAYFLKHFTTAAF